MDLLTMKHDFPGCGIISCWDGWRGRGVLKNGRLCVTAAETSVQTLETVVLAEPSPCITKTF